MKGLKESHVPQDDPMFSEGPTLYIKESDRRPTPSTPISPSKRDKPTGRASPRQKQKAGPQDPQQE